MTKCLKILVCNRNLLHIFAQWSLYLAVIRQTINLLLEKQIKVSGYLFIAYGIAMLFIVILFTSNFLQGLAMT
jgi:hypothetical protein